MSALLVALISFLFFLEGYFFYAKFIEKVIGVNPHEATPAYKKYDGVDFIPAKNWLILFGHHFSSIAGAAPIVGPVIAISIWGWGPTLAWIILGSIFIGAVHDFSSLVISIKNEGRSIADITKDVISLRAKYIFSLFVFFALILVVAVFSYLCAKTFVTDGRIIFPSLGLIPVAMFVGFLIYKIRFNQTLSTIIGLTLLGVLIYLSTQMSITFNKDLLNIWIAILLLYAFFASILPVNILLQPRDYLSAYLLFFGIIVGFLGVFISCPSVNAPVFIKFNPQKTFPLWPLLFVTVACGAVSGFHSLVASGTTSKQISNQKYAKRIGYGAMIFEAILATLALLCVSGGLNFSQFKEIMKSSGPIVAFSKGFGILTFPLLKQFGAIVGVIILNAFILTTLDTATRITRYIFQEITGIKNRWFSTFVVIILAGFLAQGERWKLIWPTFGASNQLVAALALFVITLWLISKSKPYLPFLLSALFMLATTLGALFIQLIKYFKEKEILLFTVSLILICLAIYLLWEVIRKMKELLSKK